MLARILTPDDFGIIGIVAIFIALSQMVADSEMGGALLRKKRVDNVDYSTLFWYNLVVSVLIYIILFCIAPLIANFYHRIELVNIVRILGITVLINAFRITQKVMALRALQFKVMAVINVISGIISLFVALWMAYKGFRYWALVGQQIVKTLGEVVLLQCYNRFIPSLIFSKESFKYQFSFGISLLVSDTVKTIANNISINIIAKIAPLQFTGYYTQSSRITGFCQSTLGALMDQSVFPMMAKMSSSEQVYRTYLKLLKLLFLCGIPISILFILLSKVIILIILGSEWIEASWVFQLLSLSILPVCIQMLCRNILKVVNATKLVLSLETIKSVIVIVSLFLSISMGPIGLVWALVLAQMLSCLIWLYYTTNIVKPNKH